jgi:hypothetical protein
MPSRLLTASLSLAIALTATVAVEEKVAADNGPISGTGIGGNAYAQGVTSGAQVNGSDVTVNAGLTQGSGAKASPTNFKASSGPVCTSQAVDSLTAVGLINQNPGASVSMNGDPGTGTWYVITCPGTTPSLLFVSTVGRPAAQPPLTQPRALAQEALATMRLPGPMVEMSPPSGAEVVNFQDWLWVAPSTWHPISATATAGPVSATATATPTRVVYDMGNGGEVVCDGAGTPYDPTVPSQEQSTSCSYTYIASSAGEPGNRYTATATIYWSVRWTAAGAPGGGNLGEIPGDTTSTSVEVDEIQAINTASR